MKIKSSRMREDLGSGYQPNEEQNGLPGIDSNPNANIVIYDGSCNFCIGQVRNLNRWAAGRLVFISLHDPRVAQIAPDLTHEMMMEQMYVVDQTGAAHGGAAGLRYLSRSLPKLWFVAPFFHIPFSLPFWQWGYRQVAKRRYKISGKKEGECDGDSCDIHFR